MTLHSLKETKLSIADKKGNFYTVALGEELQDQHEYGLQPHSLIKKQ